MNPLCAAPSVSWTQNACSDTPLSPSEPAPHAAPRQRTLQPLTRSSPSTRIDR